MRTLILFILGILCFGAIHGQLPAFPGAEGGGMYTSGGRGGVVYYVNTLDDTSTGNSTTKEGSLRWCLSQDGTKTILFKVGGTIRLTKSLKIAKGNLTIAGQSAPGDGICLADYPVFVEADNVIIRYMRFRMGDEKVSVGEADGADALGGRFFKNVIIDHCSISWCTDECSSFYDCNDFTLQWSVISESLRLSKHDKGPHGYGGIWGGTNATFHHNLLAHNDSRNPRMGPGQTQAPHTETVDMRNNVIYNWVGNSCYGGEAMNINIVNNYYKPGPGSPSGSKRGRIFSPDKKTDPSDHPQLYNIWGQYYIDGNVVDGTDTHALNATSDNWNYGVYNQLSASYGTVPDEDKAMMRMTTPFLINTVTTHTAANAFDKVMEYAGASLKRDELDSRIVNETRTGTAAYKGLSQYNGYGSSNLYPGSTVDWKSIGYPKMGIIDSQSDLKPVGAAADWSPWPTLAQGSFVSDSDRDGIPDGWLTTNHPGKTAADVNEDGYTYLEVYLNSLVAEITAKQNENAIDEGEAKEEERMLVNENFQSWTAVASSATETVISKTTDFSGESFDYKIREIQVDPTATNSKFDYNVVSSGYLMCAKSTTPYIEISPLASITRVEFIHAATGGNRGFQLWKKVGDGEWVSVSAAVANPAGGSVVKVDINEKNVALKFTNIAPSQNAYLTDLKIWGMHTSYSKQVTLVTSVNIAAAGTVSRSVDAETYDKDSKVTLNAKANFGYKFVKWTDDKDNELSANAEFELTLDSDKKIQAIFEAVQTHSLTVNIDGSRWGKIKLSPEPTDGKYEKGTIVTATVISNSVTTFNYWEDASSTQSRTFEMAGDKIITATFDEVPFIVGWDFQQAEPKTGRSGDYYSESVNTGSLSMYKPDGSSVNWLANTGSFNPSYPCARLWTAEADFLTERRYFQASFSTKDYKNIQIKSLVSGNYQVYTKQKMQYSVDGTTFTDLVTVDIKDAHNTSWVDCNAMLPAAAENQTKVYLRWIADTSSEIKGTGNDGMALTNVYVYADKQIAPDNDPPVLLSSVPAEGAANASVNGVITLTFDEKIQLGTGAIIFNGEAIVPTFGSKTVTFKYSKLSYNTSYILTVPAGALKDMSGNEYAGLTLSFSTMQRQQPIAKVFDFVVAKDGSGDGTTVQSAIDAAPADGSRFLVFVKKGKYEERPYITAAKKNISFTGQGIDDVVISAAVYSGLNGATTSTCQTFEVLANNIYFENMTIENTAGLTAGQAVALKDYGKYNTYKNVRLLGHQDTHLTGNSSIQYYKECDIRGTVDFIFGGGDIFFDKTLLYCIGRSGGDVIVAPSTLATNQYGYVFRDCTIDGDKATQHNTYLLGRPWQNSPRAVFINTTMNILPTSAGWTNMGVIPALFAEYNSTDSYNDAIDLSNRKNEYTQSADNGGATVGNLQTVLTDAEAAGYTIGNVLSNTVGWDPQVVVETTLAPAISVQGNKIVWDKVDYAISYVVLQNDSVVAFTKSLNYLPSLVADYTVIAVSEYGALSQKSNMIHVSVVDNAAPLLTNSVPANNATAASVNGHITLTFNEDIEIGAGDALLNGVTLGTPVLIDARTVQYSYSNLLYETQYTVTLPKGVVKDKSENEFAGTVISFKTGIEPDITAPVLLSSLPTNNAVDVSVNGVITLSFDEPIVVGTGDIKLNNVVVTPVAKANVLSIIYSALEYETLYTLVLPQGVVKDVSGNGFSGATITFTTAEQKEMIAPALLKITPADNTGNIPVKGNIILEFDEPVKQGIGKIKFNGEYLTPSCEGNIVTIPYKGLHYQITYHLEIASGAVTDIVGNEYVGKVLNYTTIEDPRFADIRIRQENGYLYLTNLPENADLYIYGFNGAVLHMQQSVSGNTQIPFNQHGILSVRSKDGKRDFKLLKK